MEPFEGNADVCDCVEDYFCIQMLYEVMVETGGGREGGEEGRREGGGEEGGRGERKH